MTYRLTIDFDPMGPAAEVPGMATLKRWQEEGKIALVEASPSKVVEAKAPAYNWPGAPPKQESDDKPVWGKKNRSPAMQKSGKADFKGISSVLFPLKDHTRLNMSQINSVAHLIKHHSTKNEIFVTNNRQDFIDEGRREILQSQFGIVTMTPEEAVHALGELQGWSDQPAKKSRLPEPTAKKKKKSK